MKDLTKISGTSFADIMEWLVDNGAKYSPNPINYDVPSKKMPLERVLKIQSSYEEEFKQCFGEGIKNAIDPPLGDLYCAEFSPESIETLKEIGGIITIIDGKVLEKTYVSYTENL